MRQRTRVTSYSLRNSAELPSSPSASSVSSNNASRLMSRSNVSPTTSSPLVPLSSLSQRRAPSTSPTAAASPNTANKTGAVPPPPPPPSTSTVTAKKYRSPSLSRTSTNTATARLSRLLSSAALPTPPAPAPTPGTGSAADAGASSSDAPSTDTTNFAAFKALPIDRARREGSGGTFVEPSAPDDLAGVSTCQEAVGLMVDAIASACVDAHARTHAHDAAMSDLGKGTSDVVSVLNEDIVRSLIFLFNVPSADLTLSVVRQTIEAWLRHERRLACTRRWNMALRGCCGLVAERELNRMMAL